MESVVVILGTDGEVSVHASTGVRETVLETGVGGQIGTTTISGCVSSCAEIALATDVLNRRIGGNEMAVIG